MFEFYNNTMNNSKLKNTFTELSSKDIGNFNVFKFEPLENAPKHTYRVRDFYKITLVKGKSVFHYADKSVKVEKQAIAFSDPLIPYNWEQTEKIKGGYSCMFTKEFFNHFGNLNQYALFQPNGTHIFELTDEEWIIAVNIFEKMLEEIKSEYTFKYDILRTLAYELIHLAMKLQPSLHFEIQTINASQRIASLFIELLERQFPIDEINPVMKIRSASDYASQLSVHTNHLNRVVKEVTLQTTTQIIGKRIIQEAKTLLKHSSWNITEIAYSLGFEETAHFNNFFKKEVGLTPLKFRNV